MGVVGHLSKVYKWFFSRADSLLSYDVTCYLLCCPFNGHSHSPYAYGDLTYTITISGIDQIIVLTQLLPSIMLSNALILKAQVTALSGALTHYFLHK